MLLAAELRHTVVDSGFADRPGTGERYLLRSWTRQTGTDSPPANWRNWVADFWTLRKALHGGGAPPDTAFFALAGSFLTRFNAPAGARAAVALGEALTRRRAADGVASAQVLVDEARSRLADSLVSQRRFVADAAWRNRLNIKHAPPDLRLN